MTSMLREVVLHGTAIAAAKIPYPLAGKTGTTNDFTDAWFIGFSPSLTCGVWIGYDEKKTLGDKETGGHAALPYLDSVHECRPCREGSGRISARAAARHNCHREEGRYARRRAWRRRDTLSQLSALSCQ